MLHAWMYTERHRPDRSELAAHVIGEFRLAVLCFFVLSGFLLALPWVAARAGEREPPQLGRYALRRLARIGPAYWVAVAGSVAVLYDSGHSRAVPFSELPKIVLFAQNVLHSTRNQLDPPMWSMHVEATSYVALPLIGLALVRAGRSPARALAICGALVLANLVWRGVAVAWQLPPEAGPSDLPRRARVRNRRRGPRRGRPAPPMHHGARRRRGRGARRGRRRLVRRRADHRRADRRRPPGRRGVRGDRLRPGAPARRDPRERAAARARRAPVLYWQQIHARLPERLGPALLAIAPLTVAAAAMSWFLVERPAIRFAARAPVAHGSRTAPRSRPQPAES